MNQAKIDTILFSAPYLEDKLYCRGFLFTNSGSNKLCAPFLQHWTFRTIRNAYLFVHPKQTAYFYDDLCLIGHAYDPVSMQADEEQILKQLSEASDFYSVFHRLTGIFTLLRVSESLVEVFGDPTGMQTTFYSVFDDCFYVSSHTMLLGELLSLKLDPYVERLSSYRFFPLLGNSLPGNLTQFTEVKRLVPNHSVTLSKNCCSVKRFYTPHKLNLSHDGIVDRVADLLHKNLKLITEKWEKPAISMTGGCDSKTTLACAEGLYDRFSYFSYSSTDSEKVDAEAAAKICGALGLLHKIYWIPETDEEVPGAVEAAKLLRWNTGDLRNCNPNDVRKRVVFTDTNDFDIEVKSWASEVGRAYYSKRFHGRTDFGPEPTPRACTTLYKFFLHNRRLVRETDRIFADYLKTYFVQDPEAPLPWQEQFFWEFRMPSWNGLVITGEHRYSFDITIPYNNRLILELLLSASTEEQINDVIHSMIRKKMNPAIDGTGIAVQNVKHTSNRAKLEGLYYRLNTRLP